MAKATTLTTMSDKEFKRQLKAIRSDINTLKLDEEDAKNNLKTVRGKRKAAESDLLAIIDDGTDPQMRLGLKSDDNDEE